MALPGNLATRRVTARYTRFDGKPDAGTITLTPSVSHLYDASLDVTVTRVPITLALDNNGVITGKDNAPGWPVPVTDDPDLTPQDFTYELHVKLKSGYELTKDISIPASTESLDLLSVTPVAPVSETASLVLVSDRNQPGGFAGVDADGFVSDSVLPADSGGGGSAGTYTVDPAIADGTTDNTAAIQGLLDTARDAGGGTVRASAGQNGAPYVTSAPLVMYANTVLDTRGATILLAPGSDCNMLQNAAVATTARGVIDGAISATSATLTSATAAFTAADAGQPVRVYRAGVSGEPLDTTIQTVTDASTVTLADPAATTVTDAYVAIGPYDSDITVVGGIWDRGENGNSADRDAHSIVLRRAQRIIVRDLTYVSSHSNGSKYGVNLGDCSRFEVSNLNFDAYSDGVHLNGPCSFGAIRDIYGTTGDDGVAVLNGDFVQYQDVIGDHHDITIENVAVRAIDTRAVRLIGDQGYYLRDLHVAGVHQLDASYALDLTVADPAVGDIGHGNITLTDIHGGRIDVSGTGSLDRLTIDGLYMPRDAVGVDIDGPTVDHLVLTRAGNDPAGAGTTCKLVNVTSASVIHELVVTNSSWAAPTDLVSVGGSVDRLKISNCHMDHISGGAGNMLKLTGTTVPTVLIDNTSQVNDARLGDIRTSVDFFISNYVGTGGGILAVGTIAVTVRGASGFRGGDSESASGATLRSLSLGFTADVALLTPAEGDLATNTNDALSCGTGPVGFDGTTWVHLITGATYTPA